MASASSPPRLMIPPVQMRPQQRRWTCAEFHQLGDIEGRRALLVHGEILEMPGPNPPHATANSLADDEMKRSLDANCPIRKD